MGLKRSHFIGGKGPECFGVKLRRVNHFTHGKNIGLIFAMWRSKYAYKRK